MKLLVGLGNPGEKYAKTRHNVGFMTVVSLASREGVGLGRKERIGGKEVLLLLPQTFMNRSGEAVRQVCDTYRISDGSLMVVHDDLDLPLGRVKRDFDAGSAGHRGVASVIDALGTKGFHRIRIGIGRPPVKEDVEPFVLAPFEENEKDKAREAVEEAVRLAREWVIEEDNQ